MFDFFFFKIGLVVVREFCWVEGLEKILLDELEMIYGREVFCCYLIDMEVKVKYFDGIIVLWKMIDY